MLGRDDLDGPKNAQRLLHRAGIWIDRICRIGCVADDAIQSDRRLVGHCAKLTLQLQKFVGEC